MRTNSIISDPQPFVPALSGAQKPKKEKPNDYEKLANSEDYPQLAHYINSRISFYQRYLPGGKEIKSLSKEKRIEAWGSAVTIIEELESLMNTVNAFKRKPEQNGTEETV